MSQKYENIMVAVDGSHEAELAFEKGVNVSLRNGSKLTIVHVIDTRALQSVSTFDAEVYEELQEEALSLIHIYHVTIQIEDPFFLHKLWNSVTEIGRIVNMVAWKREGLELLRRHPTIDHF